MGHLEGNSILDLQHEFLSVFYSGVYLSKADILNIAAKLGYKYPKKNRDVILKSLLKDIEGDGREEEAIGLFSEFFAEKKEEYSKMLRVYPESASLFGAWLAKIEVMENIFQNIKSSVTK